jgi:hypothetical protein
MQYLTTKSIDNKKRMVLGSEWGFASLRPSTSPFVFAFPFASWWQKQMVRKNLV